MSITPSVPTRTTSIQDPIIPFIGQLIKDNPGTINFGQGVVNYSPPTEVHNAITSFFANPLNHRYKAVDGLEEFKAVLYQKLARENSIRPQRDWELFVTAGSNMGFLQTILAISDPGDEIIILSPYYFNHEMAIRLANATPIIVDTDLAYQPILENIIQAINKKTRAIVTISPNNPTGAVYSKATLIAINELCALHGIYHINDEAYEYFVYDGIEHYSPASHPDAQHHTITLFSFSKTYAMASWRIGYLLVPHHLTNAIKKIQDTNLICAPVISQFAALAALTKGRTFVRPHIATLATYRTLIMDKLTSHQHLVSYGEPKGAFYFLIKVDTTRKASELAQHLIEKYRVAIIPGEAFGKTQGAYFRIAYGALGQDAIETGINRLLLGLEKLLEPLN